MEEQLTPEENAAWRSWLATSRRLSEHVNRSLQHAEGMPLPDFEILAWLAEADCHRLRMHRLAELVVSSRSRLSHQINRLEAQGLVARETCAEDGRGLNAVLTERGLAAYHAAAPWYADAIRGQFFGSLTARDVSVISRACAKLNLALLAAEPVRAHADA